MALTSPTKNDPDTFVIFDPLTGLTQNVKFSKINGDLYSNIDNIVKIGTAWPQTLTLIDKPKGFLSPSLIAPNKEFYEFFDKNIYSKPTDIEVLSFEVDKKVGEYEFQDWRGFIIKPGGLEMVPDGSNTTINSTDGRFKESTKFPSTNLKDKPYSTRDYYLLFNDTKTDYFKHGLQIIDNLGLIEDNKSQNSHMRLDQFQQTPFENNDPVMFGFEIIIDDVSSPLLNGSVLDFLKIYSGVDEIKYRIPVYEDFKEQFKKLFRTKTTFKNSKEYQVNENTNIDFNVAQASISKSKANYANTDSSKDIFRGGKPAYLSYYLKKIGGLANLIESNTTDKKKFLVDYRTDVITLDFNEDVSLTMGTLAHLYKLLYWSKPNGKSLVPENLLRFNCDIIVSECRNFNRVRKAIDTGDLEVIKDNVSRYIYSLKECQLFFNTMPHNPDIDMSAIATYDNYSVQFDYKYSTVKFERFMPSANFGKYIGYDGGAIWKIGNPGARVQRGGTQSTTSDTSLPRFFTFGTNATNDNGVKSPLVLEKIGINLPKSPEGFTPEEKVDDLETNKEKFDLDKFIENANLQSDTFAKLRKKVSEQNLELNLFEKKEGDNVIKNSIAKNFIEKLKDQTIKSAKRELATLVNGRVNLLSRTANKLLIDFVGKKGITPPQNVYRTDQGVIGNALNNISDRFFYDIRNDLADFAGGAVSNVLNGATNFIKK